MYCISLKYQALLQLQSRKYVNWKLIVVFDWVTSMKPAGIHRKQHFDKDTAQSKVPKTNEQSSFYHFNIEKVYFIKYNMKCEVKHLLAQASDLDCNNSGGELRINWSIAYAVEHPR